MKKILAFSLLAIAAFPVHSENGVLLMSINNIGNEQDNQVATKEIGNDFVQHLANGSGAKIKSVIGSNSTNELQRTRTGYYDLILAPAHIIASAVKNEYIPVASIKGSVKAQLVARKDSGITNLAQMKGKRLCLPAADSLATYLAKGILNDKGITPKSYFSEVKYARYEQSCLYSLENKMTDVATVTDETMKSRSGNGAEIIALESNPVPSLSLAVNKRVPDAVREKIQRTALSIKDTSKGTLLNKFQADGFVSTSKENFDYVAKLGYYTPSQLQGATQITAKMAKELMSKGVKFIDTRSEHEYKESHIPGAVSVTYHEKSEKTIDFDPSQDKFDLTKLPQDKAAPLIFACNGAECWKSYKASVVAIKNGYTKVYWFRGGFPEWVKEGFSTDKG